MNNKKVPKAQDNKESWKIQKKKLTKQNQKIKYLSQYLQPL